MGERIFYFWIYQANKPFIFLHFSTINPKLHHAGTSHDHENPETESYVLYCFRIQGYISDEKLVLGTCGMDCLFLGIYNSVFPVWKLGI